LKKRGKKQGEEGERESEIAREKMRMRVGREKVEVNVG